jgi:hypothetical protein
MAVRDKNLVAWQAYVITMAFISVGLMLGMFFLYRTYADTAKRSAEMSTKYNETLAEAKKSEARVLRLKSMLGYGEYTSEDLQAMATEFAADPTLGEVEKDFAEQMKLFAKNDKDTDKNLLKLPKFLMDTIRLRNEELDRARKREAEIQKEQTDTLARETAAREDAQKKMAQATQDLEAERAKHAKQIEVLNSEKETIAKQFAENKAAFDKKSNAQAAMIATLEAKNKEQAAVIIDQQEQLVSFREDDFAAPQGEITRVTDGGQTVWLDLGSADGLREGVPFSVIPSDTVKVSKATPKARLQVTKVVDAHLAQAKATDLNPRNPIMTGDKIYSPAWRAGRSVGFALVGSMDIDGNFQDDSEMVKDLIRASGARIDAVMDTKLAVEGKIGVGTAYIVMGADTVESENLSPDQKAKTQRYNSFIKEAKSLGATQMSLDNLLGFLKPKNTDRTISLGNRISGADFPIQQSKNPPVSTGKVSEIFEKRRPN